jgi:hypothetical protein
MVEQPLRELQTLTILFFAQTAKVGGPFFTALAVHAMVMRLLAYRRHHSAICQLIQSQVVVKSAGSAEPVFTSMDVLLYGLYL